MSRPSVSPRVFRDPIDKDARPRQYDDRFLEHERALAWQRQITAEHYALYGMRQGCRHTSNGFYRNKRART